MTRCDFCGTWMAPRNLMWSQPDPVHPPGKFQAVRVCRDRKLCRRRAKHNLDLITPSTKGVRR